MPALSDLATSFDALQSAAVVADISHRSQLQLTGGDAVIFLHNLCTNDIKKLETGQGCEAFLTTVQGKIVAFVYVYRNQDDVMLESAEGQGEPILAHLDRYVIREDVEIHDRSSELGQVVVAGPKAADAIQAALGFQAPSEAFAHVSGDWRDGPLSVRHTRWLGDDTWQVSCSRGSVDEVLTAFRDHATSADPPLLEAARILAGSPDYGRDISSSNLPQEIDRDESAISFVKGCYLGQETVARIDALGHVNRKLAKLAFQADALPETPLDLRVDDKVVGQLTTAAIAPSGGMVGLGIVRCAQLKPGAKLAADFGEVVVSG